MKYAKFTSRRRFLSRLGCLGAAGLVAPFAFGRPDADSEAAAATALPIKNILICCTENRTFDQYYGKAPFAGNYGIPPGYTQPSGVPFVNIPPVDDTTGISPDPNHDWATIHGDWDNGKCDGFVTSGTVQSMTYEDPTVLPYYYSLFPASTLCVN